MAEHRRPPELVEARGFQLRRQRVDDAVGIAAAVAESLAELGQWMPWADNSAAEPGAQRRRLQQVVPNWERDGEYAYVIVRPGQDRIIGCVALLRRVSPVALEIGYWLRTDETGRGTMTEAVRALTEAAMALEGIDRVEIHCDEANQKSAAIARRLGFSLARTENEKVNAPGQVGRRMVWVLDRATLPPTVFYLIGLPGVGKFTVAKAMARLAAEAGQQLVVVDNHYVNNPIFGVIDTDGSKPLAQAVWDRVAEVGEAIFTTIETLSPQEWSFVFTNYLAQGEPGDWRWFQRVRRLAKVRSSQFVPVRLLCDTDELCRRVTSLERRERLKLVDPAVVRELARTKPPLMPDDQDVLTVDVTGTGPDETAQAILKHTRGLRGAVNR